jgi:tRNA A-37 threonylcarbamoyl transferase component Bud32
MSGGPPALPQVTAADLRAASRRPPLPCALALDGGGTLTLRRVLRLLPGKRLTGLAEIDGRPVLAKLFIAPRGRRHWEAERRGIEALLARQMPTPALLGAGTLAGGGAYLLTEFLADAEDCAAAQGAESASEALAAAFALLGRMHAAGLTQEDAHLGNFLRQSGRLYVIDGAGIRAMPAGEPLPAERALANLALLLAQLPPTLDGTALLAAYRSGNPRLDIPPDRLAAALANARDTRMRNFLRKCVRDCSMIKVERRFDRFTAVVRDAAEELAPVLADPDRWMAQGVPLKQGRTSTVALVEQGGRKLVLKRYNIKNLGHAISRSWRPSRAWHSWVEAHRLTLLGIATPRPLALIEERLGPLRRRAWLIVEHCAGERLDHHLAPWLDAAAPAAEAAALRRLFAQLTASRISHGDLKASNLLWTDGGPVLIDLDAVHRHRSPAAFGRAWRGERARFLRNWPEGSALRASLAAALPD